MSECARCGVSFEPQRSTAKFCSDACRKQASRALSVTSKVSVTGVSAPLASVLPHSYDVPSIDLTRRAACPDDYLLLDHFADIPSADDIVARGFYRSGMTAGLDGKTGPFMTAADVFFYRGWRCARGRSAGVPGEQRMLSMLKSERIAA
jgi:hypothetical protein